MLITLGPAIAAHELRLPANVAAEQFVPHAAVLPHTHLVVTHAGHGTAMAAMTAGIPMVCIPMARDQHAVAGCVERRDLGRVVSMSAPPAESRQCIEQCLTDTELRERARNFGPGSISKPDCSTRSTCWSGSDRRCGDQVGSVSPMTDAWLRPNAGKHRR